MSGRQIALCFGLFALMAFSLMLLEVPTVRLMEMAICDRHYATLPTQLLLAQEDDESRCKIPAVQNKLTTLMGFRSAFVALPGFLSAWYYSTVAERHGYWLVLCLATLGEMISCGWIMIVCKSTTTLIVRVDE